MSNLPPPPPPPGFPASAPPPQEPAPFVPMAPIGAPEKKSKKGLLIGVGAIVAVAAIGAGAFVLLSGDDGGGDLNTSKALPNIEDIVDAPRLDADNSRADLDDCPIVDLDDLADLAPKAFDPSDILDGDTTFDIEFTDADDPRLILCRSFISGQADVFGIYVGEVPDVKNVKDFQDYTESVLSSQDVTFEKTSSFKGGTLVPYCSVPKDSADGDDVQCETDWFNDEIQVGIFASSSSDEVESSITTAWLKSELAKAIKTLEGTDPGDFPPVSIGS